MNATSMKQASTSGSPTQYYHISAQWLGVRPALRPRIPRDRVLFENATVKRICVAPTLAGCLLALQGAYYNQGLWYVYATDVQPVEPVSVPDAPQTGELWLLEPVRLGYVGLVKGLTADAARLFRWQDQGTAIEPTLGPPSHAHPAHLPGRPTGRGLNRRQWSRHSNCDPNSHFRPLLHHQSADQKIGVIQTLCQRLRMITVATPA
jgi:hypothetical protein